MRIAVCPGCGMQTLNDYGTYYECSHCGLKLVSGGATSASSGLTPSPSGVTAAAPITEIPTDESDLILYIGPTEAHLIGVKRYLDKVVLPDKVDADSIPLTTIEAEAFKNVAACVNTILVPDSVKTIERFAASKCRNLRHFRLPSTITEIPQGMFYGCEALREVEIPSSV
ncbi:MAG: leucine-rich repeat domain-containing protein, partial [Bacilli bacterium]|nr:leucine-rich repeat domain-containing protein [Bacilli bacterium]